MRGVCPEYERRLRAYERAFNAWTGHTNLEADGAADACLNKIEKKHQALTDHQQSCAACLAALGKGPIQNVYLRVWRASYNLDIRAKKAKAS